MNQMAMKQSQLRRETRFRLWSIRRKMTAQVWNDMNLSVAKCLGDECLARESERPRQVFTRWPYLTSTLWGSHSYFGRNIIITLRSIVLLIIYDFLAEYDFRISSSRQGPTRLRKSFSDKNLYKRWYSDDVVLLPHEICIRFVPVRFFWFLMPAAFCFSMVMTSTWCNAALWYQKKCHESIFRSTDISSRGLSTFTYLPFM